MAGRKKNIYLAVSVLFIGLLIMVGTFSYWTWTSNENKNIVFNTAKDLADYIIYDSGESKFVGDFKTSNSYTDGVHTTVSVYKKEEASKAILYATIYMKVNSIGNNLSNTKGLKWVITEGDSTNPGNILAEGNFIGAKAKDEFIILPSIEVTTSKKEYTVWIWLDSKYATADMSGETLDTIVWTQVDQVIEDNFEITRLSNNYQIINATVVNATKNIVSYAITNSNVEPSDWVNITDEEQSRIYTLEYAVSSAGTYYVWFKDTAGKIINKSIEISEVNNNKPSCTFSEFNPVTISNGDTSKITLTCTDNIGLIGSSDITKDNLVLSSEVIDISKIEKENIDNGYKYIITVTAKSNTGNVTIKLNNNVLINSIGNGNEEVTSNKLGITSTFSITYKDVGETEFSGVHGANAPITYESGVETNLVDPTKSGYTFKGWFTTSDGSGDAITKIASTQKGNIILYAKWVDDIPPTGSVALSLSGTVITATVTASDSGSGIKEYGYIIQASSTCPTTGYTISTNSVYNFDITSSGTYYVCIKITDNAGNSATISKQIVVTKINYTYQVLSTNYSCANKSSGSSYIFIYTGNCEVVDDSATGTGNWKIKFLTSGALTTKVAIDVDVFLVGGGGGGQETAGIHGGSAGGGGYTQTYKNISISASQNQNIQIGSGGAGGGSSGSDGGQSYFISTSYAANGGIGAALNKAGNGGSGGGCSGAADEKYPGIGGSDGSSGTTNNTLCTIGYGQGTTTREFGESSATLYAGGGTGGQYRYNSWPGPLAGGAGGGGAGGGYNSVAADGVANTGGGGGGGTPYYGVSVNGGNGGSGIVIIRNAR